MADFGFSCDCGAVCGTLHDITPRSTGQIQCHCDDCRRAIVWLGQPDPGSDGVHYVQTTPDRVTFTKGGDALRVFTWKNRKLLRWYAPCCNAVMFNTLHSPTWAFVTVVGDRIDGISALGAVKAHGFVPKPNGKRGHIKASGFFLGFAKRTLAARLSGRWRVTPFFDSAGVARAKVQNLSHAERATAQI